MNKSIVPVLSEEDSNKLLSKSVNKDAIHKMLRISNKVRGKDMSSKSVINWNVVNTRKHKDKNYPDVNRIIVFKDKNYGIKSGTVQKDGEYLYVNSYLHDTEVQTIMATIPYFPVIKVGIDNGFCWSYIEDIIDIEE